MSEGRGSRVNQLTVEEPVPIGEFTQKDRRSEDNHSSSAPKLIHERRDHTLLKRGHALSYMGVCLFTFLVYFRPYEVVASLSWLSSSAFWVAVATLAVFIPTQLGLDNRLTARLREVNLVFLLLVASLLSIPFALEPLRAWNGFIEYLKVVVIFIVLVNVVRSEMRLRGLWLLILFTTCVLSLGAINDYRLGRLALQGVRIKGMIGGLFENPNDLALHLVTMIPLAIALMLTSKRAPAKLLYVAGAIVLTAGVVVTFSRGGFIGLVCCSGFLLWKVARRSKVLVGSLGAIAVVVLIVLAPSGYGGRLSTTEDGSAIARFDDLKRSVFVAARHPLVGVGMDNYVLYSNSNHVTHNAYTQVAAEIGWPALLVYVLFLVMPFKQLRKIEAETSTGRRGSRFYYLAVGLQASLVGYMVSSFFAAVAFLWYAYYLVAYAVCLRRLYENDQAKLSEGQ